MMSANEAGVRTMNAVRKMANEVNIDKRIADACDARETELKLSLSQLAEMFGPIAKGDISLPGRHPLMFRSVRADLVSKQFTCNFREFDDGWYFVISWEGCIKI